MKKIYSLGEEGLLESDQIEFRIINPFYIHQVKILFDFMAKRISNWLIKNDVIADTCRFIFRWTFLKIFYIFGHKGSIIIATHLCNPSQMSHS